jgi:Holliday junction resolvasome RuvABC endonuclease subunit
MKILAIDPGYERMGIAILEKEKNGKEELLYSSCFKTSAKLPHHERLGNISRDFENYKKIFSGNFSNRNIIFQQESKNSTKGRRSARSYYFYSLSTMALKLRASSS